MAKEKKEAMSEVKEYYEVLKDIDFQKGPVPEFFETYDEYVKEVEQFNLDGRIASGKMKPVVPISKQDFDEIQRRTRKDPNWVEKPSVSIFRRFTLIYLVAGIAFLSFGFTGNIIGVGKLTSNLFRAFFFFFGLAIVGFLVKRRFMG